MNNSSYEIKAAKRLLKELGIYCIWIKNRKRYCKNRHRNFWELPTRFDDFIDASFTWSETNEERLWRRLYESPHVWSKPSEIIENESSMEALKKICHLPLFKII